MAAASPESRGSVGVARQPRATDCSISLGKPDGQTHRHLWNISLGEARGRPRTRPCLQEVPSLVQEEITRATKPHPQTGCKSDVLQRAGRQLESLWSTPGSLEGFPGQTGCKQ